jgi:hypothetical protein
MRFSRRLERDLVGGAKLVVSRDWRIQFASQGQGIGITGVQLHAEVDAPETLASLAEIERSRSTADMWPMLLSGDGRIMSAGLGTREEDLAAAAREAERMIAQRPMPASQREAQRQYLSELARAGSSLLDTLPDDLFFPSGEPVRSSRVVALPGGLTGRFEVAYLGTRDALGGCLERAERQVVTRIGDTERRASETWTLSKF